MNNRKKRAEVITCHNIRNYGSVYQTYATQKILEQRGLDVEFIDYRRPGTDSSEFRQKIIESSSFAKLPVIGKTFKYIAEPSFAKQDEAFSKFLHDHINLTSKSFYSNDELAKDCPGGDLYVSGSDQIWNSFINEGLEVPYLLGFTPQNAKRVALSSSFGRDGLENWEKKPMREYLSRFDCISTREKSGVNILSSLGIDHGFASIDPTLIVDPAEWSRLENGMVRKNPYILLYQLHPNNQLKKYLKKVQRETGLDVVEVSFYYHKVHFGYDHSIIPSPEAVLSLIHNASYVVTDSFHMSVFSILFNKQFCVACSPNSFNTRIENLLEVCNLNSRKITDYTNARSLYASIDYESVNQKVAIERDRANKWVDRALDRTVFVEEASNEE